MQCPDTQVKTSGSFAPDLEKTSAQRAADAKREYLVKCSKIAIEEAKQTFLKRAKEIDRAGAEPSESEKKQKRRSKTKSPTRAATNSAGARQS